MLHRTPRRHSVAENRRHLCSHVFEGQLPGLGSAGWFFCSAYLVSLGHGHLAAHSGVGSLRRTYSLFQQLMPAVSCALRLQRPASFLPKVAAFQRQQERGKGSTYNHFSSPRWCCICCPISENKSHGHAPSQCGRGRHQGVDPGREPWLHREPLL